MSYNHPLNNQRWSQIGSMLITTLGKLDKWLDKDLKPSKVKVKVVRLVESAVIPSYAKHGDAGMDLTATSISYEGHVVTYGTGLAIEIPEGHVGLLFPRSSVYKVELKMANSVGVIDSGYRGEVKVKFYRNYSRQPYTVGDRIAQLVVMPYPSVEFQEVEKLSGSSRGEGGYGSTGR